MRKIKKELAVVDLGAITKSRSGERYVSSAEDMELKPGVRELFKNFDINGLVVVGFHKNSSVACGHRKRETQNGMYQELDRLLHPYRLDFRFIFEANTEALDESLRYMSLVNRGGYGFLAAIEYELVNRADIIPDWNNSVLVGSSSANLSAAKQAEIDFLHVNDLMGLVA